jgi:hypothetical protein
MVIVTAALNHEHRPAPDRRRVICLDHCLRHSPHFNIARRLVDAAAIEDGQVTAAMELERQATFEATAFAG